MSENLDKQKMLEILVDPDVSLILSQLEHGEQSSESLTRNLNLSYEEINDKLAYVIKHEFVLIEKRDGQEFFKVDLEKLNKIMENDDNFKNVVDGLTELDQFLN